MGGLFFYKGGAMMIEILVIVIILLLLLVNVNIARLSRFLVVITKLLRKIEAEQESIGSVVEEINNNL